MKKELTYRAAGVDIDLADATKKAMARSLETTDKRVLNKLGAFDFPLQISDRSIQWARSSPTGGKVGRRACVSWLQLSLAAPY